MTEANEQQLEQQPHLLLRLRIAQTRQILSISCFDGFEAVAMREASKCHSVFSR